MQKDNCIVIYNINQEIPDLIEDITNICNIKIDTKQYEHSNNVILLNLPSTNLERVIKEINDSYLECTSISLNKFYEIINLKEVEVQKINPINSTISQLINENELFFIKEENCICLYENDVLGKNRLISKIECKNSIISKNCTYIATFGERVSIYFSQDFLLYFEIFESSIYSAEFTNDELFFILNLKNTSKIFRMSDMKCILECDFTKITYAKDLFFYLHYLNQKVDLDGNFIEENSNIHEIHSKNDMFAILTNEKVRKIIFQKHKKIHPNIFNVDFYFSKNMLYCVFIKEVKDRHVYFVECYCDSILYYQFSNEIIDCSVSDNFSAFLDSKNTLIVLERRISNRNINTGSVILKEVLKLQIVGKIIFSMGELGVLSIYYEAEDLIRFYYTDKLISTTQFYHCTNLKWSQSGCFLAALSLKSMSNNTIHFFNCNGKSTLKINMPKAVDFYWVNYIEPSFETKERIINNYEELIKTLPYKKLRSTNEDGDLDVLKENWIKFLEKKRNEVVSVVGDQ